MRKLCFEIRFGLAFVFLDWALRLLPADIALALANAMQATPELRKR